MKRRRSLSQNKLGDYLSIAGFLIGLASIVPVLTQGQTSIGFWVLSVAGLAILLFGIAIRVSPRVFAIVSEIINPSVAVIGRCLEHQIEEVYVLACSFFGEEVTEPAKIKDIRAKYKDGLQVALIRDRGERMSVQGYYFMFPINRMCVNRIIDFSFNVSQLSADDIAAQARYGHAMYIGAIAGRGMFVRRELLGAIKMSGNLISQTRTSTAYARAATTRGQQLLKKNGFLPVHPEADGLQCFYWRKFERDDGQTRRSSKAKEKSAQRVKAARARQVVEAT